MAPLELVQQLVKTWAGTDLELQAHHKPAKPHAQQGAFAMPPPPPLPPPLTGNGASQEPTKAAKTHAEQSDHTEWR